MNIVKFITQYPYSNQFSSDIQSEYVCSGAQRVAQELSEQFTKKGHEVTVITSSKDSQKEIKYQNGVRIVRYPSLTKIGNTQLAPQLLFSSIDESPDIVHVHNGTPPGAVAGTLFAKRHGLPLVITHHGGENYTAEGSFVRRFFSWIYIHILTGHILDQADAIVVPSSGFIEESKFLNKSMSSVFAVPNGVSVEDYRSLSKSQARQDLGIDEDEFIVLFMGTHIELKGPDVLLKAFTDLAEDYRDITLILAGSGPLTEELKRYAKDEGIENRVRFPGFVEEREKPIYMRAADTFVLPSPVPRSENFPLVLLEAAAANTALLASNFPTIRSFLLNSECAELIQPNNPKSIQDIIMKLYTDRELTEMYCNQAQEFASKYSWNDISDQYLSLYEGFL